MPQYRLTESGKPRRVGFELEFAGVELQDVAGILAQDLGGPVKMLSAAECDVTVPELGTFKVELDWEFAKKTAKERAEQAVANGESPDDDLVSEWLTKIASQLVPIEVVCPPLGIDDLHVLDKPIARLREIGALGTEESLLYAFGLHINAELPKLDAATIIKFLKAYGVCQSWLLSAHQVDPVRRITPYIDMYPKEYLRCLMQYFGDESLEQIMDEYLEHNPTRNRALDMTPLFLHLDEERLVRHLTDSRINGRPTFHYRMPNCSIEKPGWTLRESWKVWCVIEYLASTPDVLRELTDVCDEYLSQILPLEETWHPKLDDILARL